MEVTKFAVAGTFIGIGAAMAADYVNVMVLNPILRPAPGTQVSTAGQVGRMGFQIVAGSLVAGTIIYGGDKLMDMIVEGNDPLYRTFYTLTAFQSMRLTQQNMSNVNGLFQMLSDQIKPSPKGARSPTGVVQNAHNLSRAQMDAVIGAKKPCCGN